MTGRRLWAALHLLDRQLVDRDGRLAGNVDDLDLEVSDSGAVHVTGIWSGPGALATRMGRRRFGAWRARVQGAAPIPFNRVAEIGDHVRLSIDHTEAPDFASERWVRDHVVGRIPGSRHAAE